MIVRRIQDHIKAVSQGILADRKKVILNREVRIIPIQLNGEIIFLPKVFFQTVVALCWIMILNLEDLI